MNTVMKIRVKKRRRISWLRVRRLESEAGFLLSELVSCLFLRVCTGVLDLFVVISRLDYKDGITGGWSTLHNIELHCFSLREMLLGGQVRRKRAVGHMPRMAGTKNVYRVLVGKLKIEESTWKTLAYMRVLERI